MTTQFDNWDCAANDHLLAHLRRRLAANPKHFGALNSPQMTHAVAKLVQAKNGWAQDMRDMATEHGVPVETQKRIWTEFMTAAEAKQDSEVPF